MAGIADVITPTHKVCEGVYIEVYPSGNIQILDDRFYHQQKIRINQADIPALIQELQKAARL